MVATLNPNLEEFWQAKARNKVLYGGRSAGKSWDAAGFAIFLANTYQLRILCARQFQNKIEESVYSLLKIQIERFDLKHRFDVQKNKIINKYTGSEFLFYGLWRHIDEVKSLESIDICWLEEAHNITEAQWEILEPTIRKEHSQFWIIFNPRLATDFVYKRFVQNPPPNTVARLVNYPDNLFLSQTMLDIIEATKAEDYEEYQHIYMGVPRDDDDHVIIKRGWIMAAIDAHITLGFGAQGTARLGFDIADSGADKCAVVLCKGSVIQFADEWKADEDELLQSCIKAYNVALQYGASIVYDSIGVGASAGAKFNELNSDRIHGIGHSKFNAGASVLYPDKRYPGSQMTNRDMFSNLKAQAWWQLADRFRNTYNAITHGQVFEPEQLISIDKDLPYLDKLIDELSTPRREYGADGRVKVESKKDLARRDIASPNIADAVIMACSHFGASVFDAHGAGQQRVGYQAQDDYAIDEDTGYGVVSSGSDYSGW